MIRGFYSAVSGMVANLTRAQIISNNLANLGTVGYREDVNVFRPFKSIFLQRLGTDGLNPVGQMGMGAEISPVVLNSDQGILAATDNPLDLAIEGPGFLSIQTPTGTAYTRTGQLYRDLSGQLVTGDGMRVLGANGPITLPEGAVQFAPDGSVLVNGTQVDQLKLVEFANPQGLKKLGFNRYGSDETPAAATNSQVRGGFLEQSNVNTTRALADLLVVQRAYEASQFVGQLHDQMTGRAVNDVGKV